MRTLLASAKPEDQARARQRLQACTQSEPENLACWHALACLEVRTAGADPNARQRALEAYDQFVERKASRTVLPSMRHPWVDYPSGGR